MDNPEHINVNLSSIARRAMGNYGFIAQFPSGVVKETKQLQDIFKNAQITKSITDLRGLLWSSIDNIDSQDLDQLEFCEHGQRGEIHVFVAIADVDAYVKKASHIDKHAFHNGTSVYAEVEIFPMLPNELCTDLSSLCEGADRLAVVVDFFVTSEGNLRLGDVRRAVVHNKAKLVYEDIGAWLEDKGPVPEKISQNEALQTQVRLQLEAAERLHNFRMETGALELDTAETSVVTEEGKVTGLSVREKNLARLIIENFMIAANRTMTAFLGKNKFSYIQRILRTPEQWPRIIEIAYERGDTLPQVADSKALSDFLVRQRQRDRESFPDLSLAIVKLMGHAEYDMIEPGKIRAGHFGLALYDYTHSTAPNRRYVDIILQRLIKAVLAGENSPYTKRELQHIADWCTGRDQSSKKVERFMVKVAGAILMADKVGQVFEGIITGASHKGTYVRIFSPPVEGRVMKKFKNMEVGEKVAVRLIHLDINEGYIDFEGVKSPL